MESELEAARQRIRQLESQVYNLVTETRALSLSLSQRENIIAGLQCQLRGAMLNLQAARAANPQPEPCPPGMARLGEHVVQLADDYERRMQEHSATQPWPRGGRRNGRPFDSAY